VRCGIVGFVGFVWQEGSPVKEQYVFAGTGNAPSNRESLSLFVGSHQQSLFPKPFPQRLLGH
jgi:hypothetical protein